jgi:hypothetical protein
MINNEPRGDASTCSRSCDRKASTRIDNHAKAKLGFYPGVERTELEQWLPSRFETLINLSLLNARLAVGSVEESKCVMLVKLRNTHTSKRKVLCMFQ